MREIQNLPAGAITSPGRELNPLPSEHYVPATMPQVLSTSDMTITLTVALFWISNVTGTVIGGASAFTYWIFGAVAFFVPCCIVCAQLGAMFPYEGSIYNWTYRAFGTFTLGRANFMSFFIGTCAWLPGLLSIVSAADVIVSCLQALNSSWLPQPWQQGLVIIAVIVVIGAISAQRTRMVQHIILVGFVATCLAVLLVSLAAIMWLLKGHPSATNFADFRGWQVSLDPNTGNIALLGTVTLALLGGTGPLMMAGEIKPSVQRAVKRSLLWGGILVLVGYFVTTLALLVVEGQNAALNTGNPVQLVFATVDSSLGKVAGNITAICVMLFFIVVAVVYNVLYARLLMTAGIDRRLPITLARLNKHRVPTNAVWTQTAISVGVTAIIFFVVPLFTFLGNSADLTNKAYLTTAAALLLIWAFSFLFPFVDLLLLYVRGPREVFHRSRIFPTPVLLISCITGSFVCVATIVDTLLFSFAPTLIPNSAWWYTIGGYALICIIICAVAGVIATSETDYEEWRVDMLEDQAVPTVNKRLP
ncbi:MAG TPA: APC family permease [Ktedonobacteraceae bacterium]|jgi:glutamate:GABA antiporter|nr:APC family permease [Ktedonobacteraceae bacterium]